MLSIDLKVEVRKAIGIEWAAFASDHPRLAKMLDRELLLDQATATIAETDEFRDAMERAAKVGAAGEMIHQLIRPLVKRILSGLIA